ncbi:hypothetical protein QL919_12795 [Psychrobacter sp. APC 3426]|uniref:tetratricopeptide repeat protein n=1 Tax=Psychrobacter sp. APC 3426 TaxID=3035177 RepID=UPI0025B39004|nr:hypothetical protein [Psychrobacter sp. APC 3426]MDN3399605.1 hypothetical protein [Psychrobacter sp. APC 3426]
MSNSEFPTPLKGDNHSIFVRPSSSKLVIFFAAINMKENQFNFWQLGREIDENVIFVNDPSNQWYLNGIPSLGASLDQTILCLKKWINHLDVKEVYTVGTSMGGHAAIHYGIELGANILSFPAEIILGEPYSRSIQNLEQDIVKKDFLLEKISNFDRTIHMIIGESTPKDLINAGYIRDFENVKVYSLLGTDHFVPSVISRSSKLYTLLMNFVSTGMVQKELFSNLGNFNLYDDELFADLAEAYQNFGSANFEKAIFYAKRILTRFPAFESALYIIGDSYLRKEEYQLATNYLASAAIVAPNNADYLFKYSHAIRMLGDKNTSLHILDILIQKFPNYAKAYYARGNMQVEEGNELKALESFKLAFLLNNKNEKFKGKYLDLNRKVNN